MTWHGKMHIGAKPKVQRLKKKFMGAPVGGKMLIATPEIVRDYIKAIPMGRTRTVKEMREELAKRYRVDVACPTSSSIFVRIVSEAALEDLNAGQPISKITPFWRILDPESPAGSKISCGADFIRDQRRRESNRERSRSKAQSLTTRS